MSQVQVTILAAGMGTRLGRPFPKPLTRLKAGETLEIISQMPQNGVIFGDGMEHDALVFNSGAIARVSVAERRLHLAMPEPLTPPTR